MFSPLVVRMTGLLVVSMKVLMAERKPTSSSNMTSTCWGGSGGIDMQHNRYGVMFSGLIVSAEMSGRLQREG